MRHPSPCSAFRPACPIGRRPFRPPTYVHGHLTRIVFTAYSVVIFLFITSASYGEVLFQRLKGQYDHISTATGTFIQRTYIKDLGREDAYEGVILLKKPDMMKWVYTRGSTDEVYVKGREVIVYQPSESQAFVSSTERYGPGRSPLRLLMELSGIDEVFTITEKEDSLILRPKKDLNLIEFLVLEISENGFPVKTLSLKDLYGNKTDIELKDIVVNKNIPSSAFEFKPPDKTVIIGQ